MISISEIKLLHFFIIRSPTILKILDFDLTLYLLRSFIIMVRTEKRMMTAERKVQKDDIVAKD